MPFCPPESGTDLCLDVRLLPAGLDVALHGLDDIEERLVVQVHRCTHTDPLEGCPNVLVAIEEVPDHFRPRMTRVWSFSWA